MQSAKYVTFIRKIFTKGYHMPKSCFIKPIQPISGNTRLLNKIAVPNSSLCRSYASSSAWKKFQQLLSSSPLQRHYKHDHVSDGSKSDGDTPDTEPPEKLSLFQRYKKMLKEYWYVLLPVHMVISPLWFGGFYYAAKSGIDIIPLLELINLPEKWIVPFRSSSLGYIAVASALYKLATPARYMVTLGGTTFSVKYLTKRGLIKPVPTKAKIKSMIQNKLKNVPEGEK